MIPIKTPIVMMVPTRSSSFAHVLIKRDKDNKKQMPQIKANLDKNNNQRMDVFHLK